MTDAKFTPFELHALDESGIGVITRAPTPYTATEQVLYQGDSILIDQSRWDLNAPREGKHWMGLTDEEQLKTYGRLRFGRGPVPQHVIEANKATRLAQATRERDNLLKTNPHLQRKTAAALRIDELTAEIKQG